jgi:type I restriction enzyme S subunit
MNDWRDKQVKDFGEIITGRTPSTARKDFYDGDYNLISPADLDNGKYIRTAHKTLTKLGFEQCRALPKGTVLVGCIGNVGKLGIVGNDQSATNQQINALICNQEHDHEFVYYCFHENREKLEKRAVKTTVPILNKTNFGNFEVKVPPLPEQKKIAHILSTVQRAIEAQERIIQTTTELKKALMHKLFTEGLRHEPQKQTEIGPVPESWEVVAVGDVCRSIVPGRNKPKVFDGDIPWLTTPNIKGLDYINADVDGLRVTPDELKSSGGRLVPEKSVIMSCVGEFGVSAVTNIEIVINQQLHAFVCAPNLNPVFLCNQLRYRKPYMERIAAITTIPYLNKSKCESVPTALPSREEQDEIAHCFETLDSKRNEHVRHKQALQDLFRTLLHELMTAKIRADIEIS